MSESNLPPLDPDIEALVARSADIDPAPPASSPALHADGPWALLRLLDSAQVRPTAQPDHFTVAFDAGQAVLELDANSVSNPFRPGLLSHFRCPDRL